MYACCIVHLSSPSIFMHPFKFKATHFCLSTWVISLVCHLLPLVNCGPNGQPWNPRARQSHPSYYLLRFELKPKTHWGKRRNKDFFSTVFFLRLSLLHCFLRFFRNALTNVKKIVEMHLVKGYFFNEMQICISMPYMKITNISKIYNNVSPVYCVYNIWWLTPFFVENSY